MYIIPLREYNTKCEYEVRIRSADTKYGRYFELVDTNTSSRRILAGRDELVLASSQSRVVLLAPLVLDFVAHRQMHVSLLLLGGLVKHQHGPCTAVPRRQDRAEIQILVRGSDAVVGERPAHGVAD